MLSQSRYVLPVSVPVALGLLAALHGVILPLMFQLWKGEGGLAELCASLLLLYPTVPCSQEDRALLKETRAAGELGASFHHCSRSCGALRNILSTARFGSPAAPPPKRQKSEKPKRLGETVAGQVGSTRGTAWSCRAKVELQFHPQPSHCNRLREEGINRGRGQRSFTLLNPSATASCSINVSGQRHD